MQEPINREMENAIQVLREAGFEPEGKARLRHRFAKPGSKRKATVGKIRTSFYEVPAPGKSVMIAVMHNSDLARIRLLAFGE